MPGAMESKGDGEVVFSAPFTGLNTALPSILLPPSAQELSSSPSFSIVRGSVASPWPYSNSLFGATLGAGEYLLFATPSGYVFTNLHVYQIQSSAVPASAFSVVSVANIPIGAFAAAGDNNPIPFLEANGCVYFACLLGIYRYSPINGVTQWSQTSATDTSSPFTPTYMTIFNQRMLTVGAAATPTTPGIPPIPISPLTVAWSVVSNFSATSVGSFNTNPSVDSGLIGGYDILTNYSQGVPAGILNLGHSSYIQMTQGIVEVDPAATGAAPFTFYNYWQSTVPVGAILGTVAQWGGVGAFVTPDQVNLWQPGGLQAIGGPVMPYLRLLMNSIALQQTGALWPRSLNPPVNACFYTIYNELHYALVFNAFGVPPVAEVPPYPTQATVPQWFGLILDYNFQSSAWTQQVTPPLRTGLYQVNGPPLSSGSYSQIPQQSLLIAATLPSRGAQESYFTIATDVFHQMAWSGAQCQGLQSLPRQCSVGFPQMPLSAGHRITVRRVRIEYSWDDMSLATGAQPVTMTVTLQGTITQNTGTSGGNGVASTSLGSISGTVVIQPPGQIATGVGQQVIPTLTANAYFDGVLSIENPQVSLQWTDPSAHQRLMVHRVSLMALDSKGTMQ